MLKIKEGATKMIKKKSLSVLAVFLSFIIVSCGGSQKVSSQGDNPSIQDPNCSIGVQKKSDRYIGAFSAISTKAGILVVTVKGQDHTIPYTDQTKWIFSNRKIGSIDDLRSKKGQCLAVDVADISGKKTALAVEIIADYQIPAKQLIKYDELKKIIAADKNLMIVDSRPRSAYLAGAVPGAKSIELGEMKSGEGLKMLPADKNQAIVFYCGGVHCKLSPSSAKIAFDAGYINVRVYHEGYPEWVAKGNATQADASALISLYKKEMPYVAIDIRNDPKAEHIPGAFAALPKDAAKIKAQFAFSKKAPLFVYGKDSSDEKDAAAFASVISSWGYNAAFVKGGFASYLKADGKTDKNRLAAKISFTPKALPGEVTPEQFAKLIEKGVPADVQIVDVRESGEVAEDPAFMLIGAVNVPLSGLEKNLSKIDKSKRVYAFCSSGLRAGIARETLAKLEYKSFYVNAPVESDGKDVITLGNVKISAARINGIRKK